MSSVVEVPEMTTTKVEFSSVDTIKSVMSVLTEQAAVLKSMMNNLRLVLKESEKSSKELEKLRNKKVRVKTERSPDALPSGITKPVAISDELTKFLGVAPGTFVPRNEVTKGVSGFVKSNNLSDPTNKQKFVLDDRPAAKTLRALLGNPKEDVTYFNLQRYLKHHYLPMSTDNSSSSVEPVKLKTKVDPPTPVSTEPPVVVKKKILVKKKISHELSEEV